MTVFQPPSIDFWDDTPAAWETVVLGAHILPGKGECRVSRGKKQDKKAAPGKHGTTTTGQGFEAAKIDITWTLFPAADENDPGKLWREALAILADLEDPNRKEPALQLIHPAAAARRINAMTIDDIAGPDQAGDGTWVIKIRGTEHLAEPEKKKGAGGKGGTGKAPGKPFWGTFQIQGMDETGQNIYTRLHVVEGPLGTFRMADTGILVTAVFLGVDDPDRQGKTLTPLEEEAEEAKKKNGGTAPGDPSVTSTPTGAEGTDGNQYQGGGATQGAGYEGADIPAEGEGDADP